MRSRGNVKWGAIIRGFKMLCLIQVLGVSMAQAEPVIGLDVVSRYVWRGTDFGNAASIQPSIQYSKAGFTLGAWGAWAVNGAPGGNENDLFLSRQIGPVEVTLTDYFFPGYSGAEDIFDLDDHIIELSGSFTIGPIDALIASNLSGDDDNSSYLELSYGLVSLGMGNGFYTVKDDPDFNLVSVAFTATRDIYTISYILNPEQKTSFLVFGLSL